MSKTCPFFSIFLRAPQVPVLVQLGSQLDQIPDGRALELHPDGQYSGVLDWGVVLSAVAAAARALLVALFWKLVGLAPGRVGTS